MPKRVLSICLLLLVAILPACTLQDAINDNFYIKDSSFGRLDANGHGGYWHEYNIDAVVVSKGASGATLVVADNVTLGGYRLDAIDEYLYVKSHVEDDWDGATPALLEINFETNINNAGGNDDDVVAFTVDCYHKIEGGSTLNHAVHSGNVTVGKAARYTLAKVDMHISDIAIDQISSFRINLDIPTSDIDDVIVTYIEIKYQTITPSKEV